MAEKQAIVFDKQVDETLINSWLRLFWKLSRRRRWQLCGLIILMLFGALAEMATLGAVVAFLSVLSGSEQTFYNLPFISIKFSLIEASLIFGIVATLSSILRIALLYASNRYTFALGSDIGDEVYRRVLYQPYIYHVKHNTSEIIAGINKVNVLVQQGIGPLMQGAVALVLGSAIFLALVRVDVMSASVAMVVFATLYVLASIFCRKILRKNGKIISECEGRRIKIIQEGLGGIRDVLIDGTQSVYVKRFHVINSDQRHCQGENAFIRGLPRYIIEMLGMLLLIPLAWWISQRSSLTNAIPVLGALALGAQKLMPQLQQVYNAWASVSGNHAILLHVLGLLDNEIPEEYLTIPQNSRKEDINKICDRIIMIERLGFRYDENSNNVLSDINIVINRGDKVGFIGKTGSGKSTLIDLIMGLLDQTSGYIKVNGEQLSSKNRRIWQSQIAHVPQSIFLADATIAENIALGIDPKDIDFKRVEISAQKAQISDFINSLPFGYMTTVGERGVRLSGGQRQRIGLARALYKQANVLILDEATSALDDKTEKSVMDAIGLLGRDITVILIAHRYSTLKDCDYIIDLREGAIAHIGKYQKVIEE